MKNRTPNIYALRQESRRALFAYGLWIRIGFVGASGMLAGLLLLFDGESTAGRALLVLVGGAVLGAMSWWRVRAGLALLDGAETGGPDVSPPVSTASAASAPRAASLQASAR